MSHVLSDRCKQFYDHWDSLRHGKILPTLQDYLDQPNPELQPHVMMLDLVSKTEIPIRLFGTALVELTRTDKTKHDFMHTFAPPRMAARYADVAQLLASFPCGTTNIKLTVTSRGYNVELDCITLPLEPYPDGPPCLVMFTECTTDLEPNDFLYQVVGYGGAAWIDIGAGIPELGIEATSETDEIDLQSQDNLFDTFKEHWFYLRGAQQAPTLSEFLNRPIPVLQPHLTMLDVDSREHLVFRLIGTGMADILSMDATGQNILDFTDPHSRESLYDTVFTMVDQPCGAELESSVISTTGRPYRLHSMGFPLRRKDVQTGCIVWFNKPIDTATTRKPGVSMSNVELLNWIDVGAGVPEA